MILVWKLEVMTCVCLRLRVAYAGHIWVTASPMTFGWLVVGISITTWWDTYSIIRFTLIPWALPVTATNAITTLKQVVVTVVDLFLCRLITEKDNLIWTRVLNLFWQDIFTYLTLATLFIAASNSAFLHKCHLWVLFDVVANSYIWTWSSNQI